MREMSEVAAQLTGGDSSAWQAVDVEELRPGDWIVAYLTKRPDAAVIGQVVRVPERNDDLPGGWSSSVMVQPPSEIHTHPTGDQPESTIVERPAPTIVIPPTPVYNAPRETDPLRNDQSPDRYLFFLDPNSRQPNPEI